MKRTMGWALAFCVFGAGCAGPFLKATGVYATATATGVSGFKPVFALKHQICLQQGGYDWLQNNLQTKPWPALGRLDRPVTWIRDTADGPRKQIALEDYCGRLAVSDAILRQALIALDEYAQALSSLANNASFDAKALKDTADNAASLAGLIASDASGAAAATKIMEGVVDPIGKLADLVVKNVAAGRAREFVKGTDREVNRILDACLAYLEATGALQSNDESKLSNLINTVSLRMKGREVAPAEAFGVYRELQTELARMSTVRATLVGYEDSLASLKKAQAAMLKAATTSVPDDDEAALRAALSAAREILASIQSIHDLAKGGQ